MARQESDREDLMREATALAERAQLVCRSISGPVTIGFRRNGWLSVYFDQDPFYQFDPEGRLRRALVGGLLYRSGRQQMTELRRVRQESRTVLQSRDLSAERLEDFRLQMRQRLGLLADDLQMQRFTVQQAVPPETAVAARAALFLSTVLAQQQDFLSNSIRPPR